MFRRLMCLAVPGALRTASGVFAGAAASSASTAGRGPKWQIVSAAPCTIDASFCGFPIGVDPVSKEFSKVLKTPDGTTVSLTTGPLKTTFTNLDTGTAINQNTSGPGKITSFPDGTATVAAKGLNGPIVLTPGQTAQFGLPPVIVTAGPLTVALDANGDITSITAKVHGDVCAALS